MIADLLDKQAAHYRPPTEVDVTNTEYLGPLSLVSDCVPVSIQPASAKEIEFYATFRSMELSHVIYTDDPGPFLRNDVLTYCGRKFFVLGVRNLIELDRVTALDCVEYNGANKRV